MSTLFFALLSSLVGLAYGAFLIAQVLKRPQGDEKMREISQAIKEASSAYLKRETRVVAMVGVVVAVVLYFVVGHSTALGFVIGAIASALAGYVGMFVAVRSNARVAEAAKSGITQAFDLAWGVVDFSICQTGWWDFHQGR